MEKYLSISEMAYYAGVSRRTLIHYDQIDLFKPKKIGANGYRYYGFDQCPELDVILVLRALDMSLDEISAFLKNRQPDYTKKVLSLRREVVEEKITRLNKLKQSLDLMLQRFDKIQTIEFEQLTYQFLDEEYFIASDEIDEHDETSAYQVIANFYPDVHHEDAFSGYPIGFLLDAGAFEKEMPTKVIYRTLIKIPKERVSYYPRKKIMQRPAGQYLTGFVRFEKKQIDRFITLLHEKLAEMQLIIDGNVWELVWQDDVLTDQLEEQIIEIMIPVCPLGNK